METSDLHPDHRELIELFISHHVDFIIVGSYALAFHGYVRFTQDMISGLNARRPMPKESARHLPNSEFQLAMMRRSC
jgi:hypothetical protein